MTKWQPNPLLSVESKPSSLSSTGFSWWLVLSYKQHIFEEMLPHDLPSLAPEVANEYANAAAAKLEERLRPILIAEDRPKLSLCVQEAE